MAKAAGSELRARPAHPVEPFIRIEIDKELRGKPEELPHQRPAICAGVGAATPAVRRSGRTATGWNFAPWAALENLPLCFAATVHDQSGAKPEGCPLNSSEAEQGARPSPPSGQWGGHWPVQRAGFPVGRSARPRSVPSDAPPSGGFRGNLPLLNSINSSSSSDPGEAMTTGARNSLSLRSEANRRPATGTERGRRTTPPPPVTIPLAARKLASELRIKAMDGQQVRAPQRMRRKYLDRVAIPDGSTKWHQVRHGDCIGVGRGLLHLLAAVGNTP